MTQVHPGINIGLQYIRNTSEIHSEVTYTSTQKSNVAELHRVDNGTHYDEGIKKKV